MLYSPRTLQYLCDQIVQRNWYDIEYLELLDRLISQSLNPQMVSLAAVLGSGLPLGKEGPVMHMASIVATMLTKMLRYIKGSVENDARSTDLLAAACTMGVAVSYAAPIGGTV